MRKLVLKQINIVVFAITISLYSPSLFVTSEAVKSNTEQDDHSDECYDSGDEDGQNGPFSQGTYDPCGEGNGEDDYYKGFIDVCMSVEGNTRDVCESATDA